VVDVGRIGLGDGNRQLGRQPTIRGRSVNARLVTEMQPSLPDHFLLTIGSHKGLRCGEAASISSLEKTSIMSGRRNARNTRSNAKNVRQAKRRLFSQLLP